MAKTTKKLVMLAGGMSITPIYQVIQTILKYPEDDTEMYVVYANCTEDDILLRKKLDSWVEKYGEGVKLWYVVENANEGWKYNTGFITKSVMREHIPEYDSGGGSLALACRPPPMLQFAVQSNLEKMRYNIKEDLLIF